MNFFQEIEDELVKLDILDEQGRTNFKEYIEKLREETLKKGSGIFFSSKDDGSKIFKIVKFEKKKKKKMNKEDYPQINTIPKIISSVLINELKGKGISFLNSNPNIIGSGMIFRMLHQNDLELVEGDIINIETSDTILNEQSNYFKVGNVKFIKPGKDREAKDVFDKKFKGVFNNTSSNLFTFLIELDPL